MCNVCDSVVDNGYCVGCGVCAGICPADNLVMKDGAGFGYIPVDRGQCLEDCSICLDVCPFGPHKENEDTISEDLFTEVPGIDFRRETGFFLNSYVGSVVDPADRWRAGSGGVASWFLAELLDSRLVDRIACVRRAGTPGRLFEYTVLDRAEDVKQSGKPAYYPVELSGVLRRMQQEPGLWGVVGLPCFIKALRLAARQNTTINDRISIYAGLVCGQLCSKGFTEILIRRMGLDPRAITGVSYREKKKDRSARFYGVVFYDDEGNTHEFRDIRYFWNLWNMSSLQACRYCDDIFAETADIVFMDAWLEEYAKDPRGNNLVVTRTTLADELLQSGISTGRLDMEPISIDRIVMSQRGVLRRKRTQLAHRLWHNSGPEIPPKRVIPRRAGFWDRITMATNEMACQTNTRAMRIQAQKSSEGVWLHALMTAPHFFLQQCLKIPRKFQNAVNKIHDFIDKYL